ncbi:MAG: protein ral secretion pathway protein [Candidatus Parcubacteria bacterium]|jgi:prepilin-type N-terminal cleavage/methylation domain-containing protein
MNTITQLRARGFTLIELLVVIAIIGLLSTIIAAPIQNARKKARDSKKIAEIKAVQLALDQFSEANAGQYPAALASTSPTYIPLLPAFASSTNREIAVRDRFAYTAYAAGGASVGEPVFFAYHFGTKLENNSQALASDRDCLGANDLSDFTINAGTSTCAFYPSATLESYYISGAAFNQTAYSYQTGMIPQMPVTVAAGYTGATSTAHSGTSGNNDFDGSDGNLETCNSIRDCIFDVTGQQ